MLRHDADETTSTLSVSGLFVFIGATPSTVWLDGQLAVDKDGFVLTGADVPVPQLESVEHSPLLLSRRVGPVFSASATTAADPSSGGDGHRRGLDGCATGIRSPPGYRRRDHGTCRRQVASFASMRLRCAAELWTDQIGPLYPSTSIRRAARRPATSADRVRGAPSLRAEPNTGARIAARAAARRPV